ncbi:MAG: hypothetical protein ACR65Z_10315 [Methylocystis sp.]|jgi:hypothetical protein
MVILAACIPAPLIVEAQALQESGQWLRRAQGDARLKRGADRHSAQVFASGARRATLSIAARGE